MARLSDFGAAIFDPDDDHTPFYAGTALYNPPEQEGRLKESVSSDTSAKQLLYKADVYSFGLTLWEIMNYGRSFFDDKWLHPFESRRQCLERICNTEKDGMLSRAEMCCQKSFYGKLKPEILNSVLDALRLTLRDDHRLRSDICTVVKALAIGTRRVQLFTHIFMGTPDAFVVRNDQNQHTLL